MNEELAKRAWNKAGTDDFLRGAVCYYRGMSEAQPKIGLIFEKAIKRWVSSGNDTEVVTAMGMLNRRRPPKITGPKLSETEAMQNLGFQDGDHWASIDHTINVDMEVYPEQDTPGSVVLKTKQMDIDKLRVNQHRYSHVFSEYDIERMRRIAAVLETENVHWHGFDEFVDGFYYDMNPYGELETWERIADCYQTMNKIVTRGAITSPPPDASWAQKARTLIYDTLLAFSNGITDNRAGLPEHVYTLLLNLWGGNSDLRKVIIQYGDKSTEELKKIVQARK